MNIELSKAAAFVQHFLFAALAALGFSVLNGCADQADTLASPAASAALRYDTDEADSGTDDALCGNGVIDPGEECEASALGWSSQCDERCKRKDYKPCLDSVTDCGGDNALCASYVADPGTQFCAPVCEVDANCPRLPGFDAACNFAWCAVLCTAGQCPVGMACVRTPTFLDFQGNDRGPREICTVAPTVSLAQ